MDFYKTKIGYRNYHTWNIQ